VSNTNLIELRKVVKVCKTPAGEFVAAIVKSGSGKSTLINTVTGIDHPTGGEVFVAGTPIHQLNEAQMARWRGRNLGVIFQFFQLLPTLSLIVNVMLPMEFARLHTPRAAYRA
jgi:putative ABC transport system ATP-binding protein